LSTCGDLERNPGPVEGDIRVFLRSQGNRGGQAWDVGAGFLEAMQRDSYVRLGPITLPQAEKTVGGAGRGPRKQVEGVDG